MLPRDKDYARMGSAEWLADVERRKRCTHDWRVTADFGRLQNVTCRKCGHRRVRGY